jgi:hypothetical protein
VDGTPVLATSVDNRRAGRKVRILIYQSGESNLVHMSTKSILRFTGVNDRIYFFEVTLSMHQADINE